MKLNEPGKTYSRENQTGPMPVLFLGHGSPLNAIEDNEFTRNFREFGHRIERPKAILCISAHWETRGTHVTSMEHPPTIHDFGGFPRALYEVEYPAPGSPALAEDTRKLIQGAEVELSNQWGLDHGAWSVIRHMYPEADIPVIQMSLDHTKGSRYHYELGKELNAFRNRGVLIIGSGNLVHNLGMVAWDRLDTPGSGFDWAEEARSTMNQWLQQGNHEALINYDKQDARFRLAIPTPEHFLPLLYVLGMRGKQEEIELFNDKTIGGSLSMTSVYIHHP
jgi:4,5-DOPA dioxygenase extradiol